MMPNRSSSAAWVWMANSPYSPICKALYATIATTAEANPMTPPKLCPM